MRMQALLGAAAAGLCARAGSIGLLRGAGGLGVDGRAREAAALDLRAEDGVLGGVGGGRDLVLSAAGEPEAGSGVVMSGALGGAGGPGSRSML